MARARSAVAGSADLCAAPTDAPASEANHAPEHRGGGSSSPPLPQPDALEAEIARVRGLSIDELRVTWRKVFRQSSVPPLTKDLLARTITWRLQEQAFGGLDRNTAKLLERLAVMRQYRASLCAMQGETSSHA